MKTAEWLERTQISCGNDAAIQEMEAQGVGERSTSIGRILARENPKDREAATFATPEPVIHTGLMRFGDHLPDLASEVVPPD